MSAFEKHLFSPKARQIPALVIALTVGVLGGTIYLAKQHLRHALQEQIAGRDAQVITLWLNQASKVSPEAGFNGITANPADQLAAILEASSLQQFRGLKATRLFDEKGQFIVAFPPHVTDAQISDTDFNELKKLKPTSRFRPTVRDSELWLMPPTDDHDKGAPLLEITAPLYLEDQHKLVGIAQLLLDGENIAAEYAALDKTLALQSSLAFLVSGGVVTLVLGLAFRQLQRANELLTDRTHRLLQANQELALQAKTSAVGALTSHLIHGLKNPLSGLQHFITSKGVDRCAEEEADWELAVSTTRRMQALVNEIVRVLREDEGHGQYEVSLAELARMVSAKVAPVANRSKVRLQTDVNAEALLTNRNANLIMLILENLLHNAIQATPEDKAVTLQVSARDERLLCEVSDQGPGIPDSYRRQLFKPCPSSKEGGSGIGLAISKQLANYLGAELDLTRTGQDGATFTLSFPAKLNSAQPPLDSETAMR